MNPSVNSVKQENQALHFWLSFAPLLNHLKRLGKKKGSSVVQMMRAYVLNQFLQTLSVNKGMKATKAGYTCRLLAYWSLRVRLLFQRKERFPTSR